MATDPLKSELLALAHELGFELCRVAAGANPPHAEQFLQWLAEGRAGEMSWLERNKERCTRPEEVLPGVQSIVVLAMNYWNGEREERPDTKPPDAQNGAPARGRIAHYAWGEDYHDLIEEKLRILDRWLSERGGRQRHYVDTGPVLERDFAAVAGAGWHGKSTMLIHPRMGTWFFLAEVLTTLELAPDPPIPERCGSCTRCMTACPTEAITAPYQLDARRCISYLTIELKGSIPEPLRALIGDRIYGCDACLEACPWNRFAQKSRETRFAAQPAVQNRSLREWLALDNEEFRAIFKKSPIKRIKRRGFLRNVCVALGNIGSVEDLPALGFAAADPEPLIAEHARWAILQIEARARPAKNPTIPTYVC
jgi:epoxyqueuosine reductase